ncbi:MAG: hypothetical protein ACXVDH_08725, partial [Nocardioides sp.]
PSAYAVAQRARALLDDPTRTRGAAGAGVPAARSTSRGTAFVRDARRRHLAAAACAAVLALVMAGVLASRTDAPRAVAGDEPPAPVTSSAAPSATPTPLPADAAAPVVAVPRHHAVARPVARVHHAKPRHHAPRPTAKHKPKHGPKHGAKAKPHGRGHH